MTGQYCLHASDLLLAEGLVVAAIRLLARQERASLRVLLKGHECIWHLVHRKVAVTQERGQSFPRFGFQIFVA